MAARPDRTSPRARSCRGGLLAPDGYRWELSDRLTGLFDGLQGPTEYLHDALGSLAWAGYPDGSAELRMPDAVGNLFRTEQRGDRKYGPAGQLLVSYTPHGETRYAYDPEGNLVEKCEPDGRVWRYAWNAAGMLSKVTRPDGSAVTFAYDALGRRVSKTYRGQTTRWVWDGNVPLHEWVEGDLVSLGDAGGVPWATADAVSKKRDAELAAVLAQGPPAGGSVEQPITWLFQPESFAPMARLCGGAVLSIVCDHLGTPVLVVDGGGAVAWSAGLSAWGALRLAEGERLACPFRWPGQYEDAETGLYYNRFRYYDPESGQYASQDPIGLRGGFAFYTYPSDPLRIVDPLGLQPCGPKIHPGKQGKHVPGHNNFQPGKSELSHPNPQALLDQHHGTGVPHGPTKEVVDFQEPIGLYVTQEGGRRATARGTIHYSADRAHAHIVPAKPTEDL